MQQILNVHFYKHLQNSKKVAGKLPTRSYVLHVRIQNAERDEWLFCAFMLLKADAIFLIQKKYTKTATARSTSGTPFHCIATWRNLSLPVPTSAQVG